MEWQAGTPVKFADPQDAFERDYVMYVIEDRDSRVLVRTPLANFSPNLQPESVYMKSDLLVVE